MLDSVILKLPVTVHFKVTYIIENYIVLSQTWDNWIGFQEPTGPQ